ncbi:MAG: DUF4399 domain-containing protein [Gammaproteobacteria bacterium]|nr:DUF4399 domain-containing protein [Gammaproteobacteria bacterium]
MSSLRSCLLGAALALASTFSQAADSVAYIISPAAGAVVKSAVTVVFGLRAPWGVAPAGTKLEKTGHHHLLVDAPLPDLTQPVPKDAQHLHFGGGQTETTLTLAPGKHTLQLLLGDFAHVPHQPPVMSEVVTITVE